MDQERSVGGANIPRLASISNPLSMLRGLLLLLVFWLPLAQAHTVHVRTENRTATVLTLTYGDGRPYAQGKYVLAQADPKQAPLTGKTDAQGQIFLVAAPGERWQLKAHAEHGHGVVTDITIPTEPHAVSPAPTSPPAPQPPSEVDTSPNQASLAIFGVSLIFCGFGLYQMRRRGS